MVRAAKISRRVQQYAPTLHALARTTEALRRETMQTAKKELVMVLVECAQNVLMGNIRLDPSEVRQLRQYKSSIEKLVKKKTSISQRRLILQKGGFLGLILRPLLSMLGGLFGGGGK